ncbi:MAG: D-sedoheptulose-7-phosphate isomerase [Terriglobia bacterium]
MDRQAMLTRVNEELAESCRVKQQFSDELKSQIVRLGEEMAATLRSGGAIYWIGNGGSAADAQHLAAELVGRLRRSRRALASVALTTNASILTAVANDASYAEVFSRQVEALFRPGDMLIGMSTSGNSESVLRAIEAANVRNGRTVGLTGMDGGRLRELARLCLLIPSRDTQRIQEAHITVGHILCGLVEDLLEGHGGKG